VHHAVEEQKLSLALSTTARLLIFKGQIALIREKREESHHKRCPLQSHPSPFVSYRWLAGQGRGSHVGEAAPAPLAAAASRGRTEERRPCLRAMVQRETTSIEEGEEEGAQTASDSSSSVRI
jgi:hypothetical protein